MSRDYSFNQNDKNVPMNIADSPNHSPNTVRYEPFGYQSFHTSYKAEQNLSQFNQSQKQFDNRYLSPQAVEQQLIIILKIPSLTQRCIELSNIIKERFMCNMPRNVLNQFKPIVEDIFGHDSSDGRGYPLNDNKPRGPEGWMLKNLTRCYNSSDYDSVVSFLHPDGIFFSLIRSLMAETSAKFEFPVSQFPPSFRSMIENGTAPPFFANKIISTSYISASHLILNPFEFYIFHFGLYILNNSITTYDFQGPLSPNTEPAYFTLLDIYLNSFVPLDTSPRANDVNFASSCQSNSIWQSLSATTTNIFNLASSNNTAPNPITIQSNQIPSTLFKASIFQPQTPFNQNSTSTYMSTPGPIMYGQGEHLRSIEWRCSTFLLMLTELWFGNIPSPKTNYILRSSALDDLSIPNVQPYSANIDQMTSVRIVIKHLHNFANSLNYNPVINASNQGLIELKQAIWTSKYPLQRRLYTFIKVAFNRWPMDYTFRQPLEAWLSFIQPWRYIKRHNDSINIDSEDLDSNRMTSIDGVSIASHWKNFISDNLLYYTVIFSLLINRLLQLDLSSSRNALMIFRVMKVYSQPGFLSLLREAEEALIRNNFEQSMNSTARSPFKMSTPNRNNDANVSSAKLLAPSFLASGRVSAPKTNIGVLEHHLMSLENDSETNSTTSLFSPQMKQQLSRTLAAVQRSRLSIREFVKSVEERSKMRNRGWFDSIRTFLTMEDVSFESKDEREMYKDKMRAEEYLNFVAHQMIQCFDLQTPEIDLHARSTTSLTSSQKIFFNF